MEEQHFVLTGINSYHGDGFPFPACSASVKTNRSDLQNALSMQCYIPCSTILVKELNSLQMVCSDEPRIMEFTGVIMLPIIPKLAADQMF